MSPPIYTPDGSEVSEIVLPDGSTASQVIGPDGNVVFEAGPDIPDSGVARYEFEQNVTDSWRNNDATDLTPTGYTTDSAVGDFAKSFAGTDESVILGSNFYEQTPITLTAYVKHNGSSSAQGVITSINNGKNRSYGLYIDATNNELYEYNGESTLVESTFSIPTATWTFVGVAIDGNGNWLFFKNDQSESQTGTISWPGDASTEIGNRNAGGWSFNGDIDDVRVYDKALSAAEASNLYNTGRI